MFRVSEAEVSWTARRLLKHQIPPVEAVKTFACKVSASLYRGTASARQKYRHAIHQLEAKFLNSSQDELGEAGLIYAVPHIPTNIDPAELVSAFNATLTRLCGASQEVQFSSTSLSPDSTHTKDLLDFEHEKYPFTLRPPDSTSTPDLLLLEVSDSSTAAESHSTSHSSIDDLLCRHGLDQLLQATLIPTTRPSPTAETADQPACSKESCPDPLEYLGSLSFDGLNPYPRLTQSRAAINRAIGGTKTLDAGDKKPILRKEASNDLRQASTDKISKPSLLKLAEARSLPESLRPGPLKIRRVALARPIPRPLPIKRHMPSKVAHSPYVVYQSDRAPSLPVPTTTSDTLMDEITEELDKVIGAFDHSMEDEGNLDEATLTLPPPRPEPLFTTTRPIVPLRTSSRPPQRLSESTAERSLSFRDRLLDASRSAILAAADEAEPSELRWFHCRTREA